MELATSDSRVRGKAVCVADRRFLARALACGCSNFALNGPEEPVRCRTPAGVLSPSPAVTTVVFATLAGGPVLPKDAVRLTADAQTVVTNILTTPDAFPATREGRASHFASRTRIAPAMPRNRITEPANGYRTNGGSNGHTVRGDDRPDAAPDHDVLLERVSALGTTLSEAAGEARSLATDLRKLKRRNRAVTGALAGLKRLGSLVA